MRRRPDPEPSRRAPGGKGLKLAMLLMIMKEGGDVVFPLMWQASALLEKAIAQIDQALLIRSCAAAGGNVDAGAVSLGQAP
jgi:hypothetical protein